MKCEIVRDLLPSYVDGLTSEVSNEAVEQHLAQCEDCRAYCEKMRQEEPKVEMLEKTDREIDYFLRIRKDVFEKVLVAVMLTAVVFSLGLGGWQSYFNEKSTRSYDVEAEVREVWEQSAIVFESAEENWFINVFHVHNEEVDGKMPVCTLSLHKFRRNPFKYPEYQAVNSYYFFGVQDDSVWLDTVAGGLPQVVDFDEDDFIAIRFDDCIKTLRLADLAKGDLSSLQ